MTAVKNFIDTSSRFDVIPKCCGQTERQSELLYRGLHIFARRCEIKNNKSSRK